MHLSTADAKTAELPGHDVYRYSHVLYHDDINRDAGALYLCREALNAFSDTVMISRRHALSAEQLAVKRYLATGGHVRGLNPPDSPETLEQSKWANFENLKVASGFELTLKAILLENNYIVQQIDERAPAYKALANKQKQIPIDKTVLFAIDGYRFDGHINYLPGLKETSLKFSTLVQQLDYRAALGLPPHDLDLIDEFRDLRNQIHFPGDIANTPKLQAHPTPIVDFVVSFINCEIVQRINRLAKKRGDEREVQPLS